MLLFVYNSVAEFVLKSNSYSNTLPSLYASEGHAIEVKPNLPSPILSVTTIHLNHLSTLNEENLTMLSPRS